VQWRTTSSKVKRGVGWTMNFLRGAERFTHALLFFYVGVGMASVAPSALHTLFSNASWWRAHNLSESGMGSYT
jgi:hypothetical protein